MSEATRYKRKVVSMEVMRKKNANKRLKRNIFYFFILVLICAVFFAVCFFVFFKLKTVEFTGLTRYSEEELIKTAELEYGENLYSFKASEAEQKIKTKYPYLSKVEIKRSWPSKLKINIVEKSAKCYITMHNEYFLLSDDLLVVEKSTTPYNEKDLVELTCKDISYCVVGKQLRFTNNGSYEAYENLYNAMEKYGLVEKVDSIYLETRFDISFVYDGRIEVYIGDCEDADMKMKFFKGILTKLDDDAEGYLDITNTKEASFKHKNPPIEY